MTKLGLPFAPPPPARPLCHGIRRKSMRGNEAAFATPVLWQLARGPDTATGTGDWIIYEESRRPFLTLPNKYVHHTIRRNNGKAYFNVYTTLQNCERIAFGGSTTFHLNKQITAFGLPGTFLVRR